MHHYCIIIASLLYLDARGDLALRVSGGLEQLSGGSGWRGYLYTFTSPAPAGSRLAAHAQPGHGRRPTAGARVRRASTRITNGLLLCCFRPVIPSVATVSRHDVSTVQVCCLRPVLPSVTHRAAGSDRPQVSRLLEPRVWPALPLSPIRACRCRRHADSERPEGTFSKATPTRIRPGLHSFARALP